MKQMKKTVILAMLLVASATHAQDYGVAGKTSFASCMDATMIKQGQGALEAFAKLMVAPITVIACVSVGTAQVAYHWSEDTEENSLRWKKDKTEEEVARMEELRNDRGERGLYGYGGWGGQSSASSKTVYLPTGAYQVSQSGNNVFVNQVSKTK